MEGCSSMAMAIGNDRPENKYKESLFREGGANRMAMITVKLTEQELGLLTTLASDQLFRREFIDPKSFPTAKYCGHGGAHDVGPWGHAKEYATCCILPQR